MHLALASGEAKQRWNRKTIRVSVFERGKGRLLQGIPVEEDTPPPEDIRQGKPLCPGRAHVVPYLQKENKGRFPPDQDMPLHGDGEHHLLQALAYKEDDTPLQLKVRGAVQQQDLRRLRLYRNMLQGGQRRCGYRALPWKKRSTIIQATSG